MSVVVLMAAGVLGGAPAADAGNVCPSSDVMATNAGGVVTPADPEDWFSFSSTKYSEVWLTSYAGDGDTDLQIKNAGCTSYVCSWNNGNAGYEVCNIPPGSYNIGTRLHSGSGSSSTYSISVYAFRCGDGVDNDADGRVDYPADTGCTDSWDTSEDSEAQCDDGLDNDGDGRVDHANDTGCADRFDDTEAPDAQCSDGVDNDFDGDVDYPGDIGCSDARDNSEGATCTTAAAVTVCAGFSAGAQVERVRVAREEAGAGASHSVAGYIDLYRFTLPNGVKLNLECVILEVDATTVDPCAAAGGTFVARTAELVNETEDEPSPTPGGELASVGICEGELVLTVNNVGLTSAPAYTVC